MIFDFLKYIRPVWYFNRPNLNGKTVFPDPRELSKNILGYLSEDLEYLSDEARLRDLSWQAFQKGYIGDRKTLSFSETIPLVDEYRFVRKYHKPRWAFYCLIMRLISFGNPIKEIRAWIATKEIKQVPVFSNPIIADWDTFTSDLLISQPKVSVIIPTLNRYKYLKDVLKDLEQQEYSNFDVIVIDQSEPFNGEFYKQFELDIKVRYQEEKALWLARNTAIKNADANFLLLFDDDSRVASDWIQNHIKGLDLYNAAISSGQSISRKDQELPTNYRYFRVSDLLDTGNVLIRRKVFETVGLFDRQFEGQRMGDGEFGMRTYLQGFLNISNPYATRLHLKVGTGGLRQMGSWDAFRSKKIFAAKPIPSVLYLYRKYFGRTLSIFALIKSLPPSIVPYRFKKNKKMLIVGILISMLLIPVVIFKVLKSWRLASIKLKQGPLIERL
jgi:glycosyltransferase involved in cell wall biosynthesis